MGRDAVRDLRMWQREAAGAQEQALRAASRAWRRLESIEEQRVAAGDALAAALKALAETGVGREQAAAFLGVDVAALSMRRTNGSRPAAPGGTREPE